MILENRTTREKYKAHCKCEENSENSLKRKQLKKSKEAKEQDSEADLKSEPEGLPSDTMISRV